MAGFRGQRRVMRFSTFLLAVVVVVFSCGPEVGVGQPDDAGSGGGLGSSTGGGSGGGSAESITFCDVKPVLQAECGSCHGVSPVAGAPVLVSRADLLAGSSRGGTMLDRSIIRLSTTPVSAAMPPGIGGTATNISLFTDWRANGMPDCATDGGTGGGAGGGGGTAATTCTSGVRWSFGNNLGVRMNPGEACVSCHQSRRRGPVAGFMGTVYPSLHEATLCTVTSVPSGVSVEILDMAGVVRSTFTISAANDGNFYGGVQGMPSPYRARVVQNGVVKSEMRGAQTSGDCNVCHTEQGAQGAPGRIHW